MTEQAQVNIDSSQKQHLSFGHWSLRGKLTAIIVFVALFSLVLSVSVIIFTDIKQFREDLLLRTTLIAKVVGDFSATDIAFRDQKSLNDSLAVLEGVPNVVNVHLYNSDGTWFASYKNSQAIKMPLRVEKMQHEFKGQRLILSQPINYQGVRWGYIQVVVSTDELKQKIYNRLNLLLMLAGLIAIIAFLLARKLQFIISRPVLNLADVAQQIAKTPNYDLRVSSHQKDEIGVLYDAFNTMLGRIASRQDERNKALHALAESEVRFSSMFNSMPDAVMFIDLGRHIVLNNPAANTLFGYDEKELIGHSTQLLYADIDDFIKQGELRFDPEQGGSNLPFQVRFKRKDGSLFWSETLGVKVLDDSDVQIGFITIVRDITERLQAEEEMRKLYSAVEQSIDGVLLADKHGKIEYVNSAVEQMLGYQRVELIGKSLGLLELDIQPDAIYTSMWESLEKGEAFESTFVNRRKNGETFYQEESISPIRNENGVVTHFVSISRDVSYEVETQGRIQHMAFHDQLTGLPNRLLFRDRVEHAVRCAERDMTLLPVMFIDLDRFKDINDTLGHQVGDQLLERASERLSSLIRNGDTIARLGGDEFMVLIDGVTNVDGVARLAAVLIESFDSPFVIDEHELFVTASIGIAVYPNDASNIDDLFRAADTAMYRAKAEGRNAYQMFNAEMASNVLERVTVERALRGALEAQQYQLFYQPRVSITKKQEITFVESLIRWRPSEKEFVSPDIFIPVLEETGMIIQVGEWVMQEACRQLREWRDMGFNLGVAINVSARQFWQQGLLELVEQCIQDFNLDPQWIELEITESVMMEHSDRIDETFSCLHKLGVRIAMDDFGTGFSSLSYLKQLPLNTLKIDRAFVQGVTSDPDDRAIAEMIISLGKTLNLTITAEGVETKEQLGFVTQAGCHEVQGYLFAKPMTADKLSRWMEKYSLNRN